ncbi:hypothetical protein X798_04687 [Onchocerca flexuosa]|uniref:OTU domain-containing protein n=1 Tax=Onchocerca flexuosa TaxID=387005 RepID=A0A238BUF7_9BILA|nr:hypothetical protein X798_04687 [Onchocerca flexuosa]
MIEEEEDVTPLGQLKAAHRKERKELQLSFIPIISHELVSMCCFGRGNDSDMISVNKEYDMNTMQILAKITSMKHSIAKGDKKRKKEIVAEIAKMEEEVKERHEKELAELELSLPEISVEPTVVEQNQEKEPRISKAQRRREKKAELNRKREEAAMQARIDAENGPRKLESDEIERILMDRGLMIYDIEPDGDCLYNAVAHQLSLVTSHQFRGAEIRQKAAAYMRTHKDDFLPFLIDDNGEAVDEIEFEEYCMKVEKCCTDGDD